VVGMGIKTNIPVLLNKLDRMKKLVDKGWRKDIMKVMRRAEKTVRMLTPKSKRTGNQEVNKKSKSVKKRAGHLASGWAIHTIGRGKKDRAPMLMVIYNKMTHKPSGIPLKRALVKVKKTGEVKPYTVLNILEFGSKAHVIVPVVGKALRFVTEIGTVFTKSVAHPGTRAYGMVRLTTIKLRQWMRELNNKWRRKFFK